MEEREDIGQSEVTSSSAWEEDPGTFSGVVRTSSFKLRLLYILHSVACCMLGITHSRPDIASSFEYPSFLAPHSL